MTDENPSKPAAFGEHPDDLASSTKTLYQVTSWEIFWRNLLAGISRGLGSLLVWIGFMFVSTLIFLRLVWPTLEPFYRDYQNALKTVSKLNSLSPAAPVESSQAPSDSPSFDQILNDPDFLDLVEKFQTPPSSN